jgi:uncharacterized protein (TIGR00255 family)
MTTQNKKTTLSSMTGFGQGQSSDLGTTFHVELRSVNSRFLEIHFKIPDHLRQFESVTREELTTRLKRGKLECRLSVRQTQLDSQLKRLDESRLAQIKSLQDQVLSHFPAAPLLSVGQILAFDGVQLEPGSMGDQQEGLKIALNLALDDLIAQRGREGARLAAIMGGYIDEIEQFVLDLEPNIEQLLLQQQGKLADRITKAFQEVEQSQRVSEEEIMVRIRQEISALGLRGDVAEELDRLKSHCKEFRFCLDQGGQQGKRLDFLLQEFNREANTLGSKSLNETMTKAAIGLKQRIEQLREQVQNIE